MKKVTKFDIGDHVYCDMCSKDFTNSDEHGGFIFGSKGVCPECAPGFMKTIKKHNEEHFIRATCRPDESFKDFILRIRDGNNTVTIIVES